MAAHRAMARHGLRPRDWHALPEGERLDLLAYERRRGEYRAGLLADVLGKITSSDVSILAQVLILLDE